MLNARFNDEAVGLGATVDATAEVTSLCFIQSVLALTGHTTNMSYWLILRRKWLTNWNLGETEGWVCFVLWRFRVRKLVISGLALFCHKSDIYSNKILN